MKRILITNFWGGNRGDEAMLNVLYRLIKKIDSEVEVDLIPARDEELDIDKGIHQITDKLGMFYYSAMTPLIRSIWRFLERHRIPKRRSLLNFLLFFIRIAGNFEMNFIKQYDLVLQAPQGPAISDMYNLKQESLYHMYHALRLNVPYAILGVSMGPFNKHTRDEQCTYRILSHARKIIVREDISLQHLKEKYPDLSGVSSAIDIVYSADSADYLLPDSLKEFPAGKSERPLIGACISSTPARKPTNPFDKEAYAQKMAALFDHVIQVTKCRLVIFPHLAFDMPNIQRMISAMGQHSDVYILPQEHDSGAQQAYMRRLDFFISSRYHPTIFSINALVPVMCILNQYKTEGMLEKLKLNFRTCWQDEPLEVMKEIFEENWQKRQIIKEQEREGLAIAKSEAKVYEQVVRSLLMGDKRV